MLDQLAPMRGVRPRAMFGGHGLYCGESFFGIVWKGRLYFKTNEKTRSRYLEARAKPFRPKPRQTLKTYYEVPIDVLEDSDRLFGWAREAVSVSSPRAKKA